MEARKTDEIICANCGRPNLAEAEKCWYCQTPLIREKSSEPADDAAVEAHVKKEQQSAQTSNSHEQEHEENIPEWLKRVRELKAQDYPEEEEEDHWQQQGLFAGDEEKSALKPTRKSPKKGSQPAGKAKKEKIRKQAPQPALDISEQSKAKKESKKEENQEKNKPDKDPSSEDLPDGFIQFRPKSN